MKEKETFPFGKHRSKTSTFVVQKIEYLGGVATLLCTGVMKDSRYVACRYSSVSLMLACSRGKSKVADGRSKACGLFKDPFPS